MILFNQKKRINCKRKKSKPLKPASKPTGCGATFDWTPYDIQYQTKRRNLFQHTIPWVVARPNTCVNASRTGVNLTSLADVTTICTSWPGSKN